MTIRAKLRAKAEEELVGMLMRLEAEALQICGDSPVEPQELSRMLSTPNNKTLTARVVTRMADQAEVRLIASLKQQEEY
jgi:hypothetical protein